MNDLLNRILDHLLVWYVVYSDRARDPQTPERDRARIQVNEAALLAQHEALEAVLSGHAWLKIRFPSESGEQSIHTQAELEHYLTAPYLVEWWIDNHYLGATENGILRSEGHVMDRAALRAILDQLEV